MLVTDSSTPDSLAVSKGKRLFEKPIFGEPVVGRGQARSLARKAWKKCGIGGAMRSQSVGYEGHTAVAAAVAGLGGVGVKVLLSLLGELDRVLSLEFGRHCM